MTTSGSRRYAHFPRMIARASRSEHEPLASRWALLPERVVGGSPEWFPSAAAFALFLVVSLLLFGRQALADPTHVCACDGSPDSTAYMWNLVWWPHALVHVINPFVSHVVWVPDGANLAASASLPAPSLLLSPVTAAFGPVAAYNVLSLLSPVLAGWFTFRLCRYLCGEWLPSFVGGYLFGFSSYEVAQLTGHLNLVLIFLVPATIHLVLLRLDARITERRFVVLLTIALLLLLGTSTEILLTFVALGAVTLFFGYVFASKARRSDIVALVPKLLLAGVAACVLASPYLYYVLKGLGPNPTENWIEVANRVSVDPLNFVIPTPVTWLGHGLVTSLATKFNQGNFSESGAYLGLPVLVIMVLFLFARRREPSGRVLSGVLAVVVVASLGPHLHVANPPQPTNGTYAYRPSIPLPWLPLTHAPLFKEVAPARLAMYVSLIAAVIVAMWLAAPGRRRSARWLLAAAAVVLLVPNVSAPDWHTRLDDPRFFVSGAYRHYLSPGERALVFPFGQNGNSMLWQAQTGMFFQMTEGYLGIATPPSYFNDPIARYMQFGSRFQLPVARVGPQLRAFIRRRNVRVIIVDASAPTPWSLLVPATLRLRPTAVDGVQLYDIPASWR